MLEFLKPRVKATAVLVLIAGVLLVASTASWRADAYSNQDGEWDPDDDRNWDMDGEDPGGGATLRDTTPGEDGSEDDMYDKDESKKKKKKKKKDKGKGGSCGKASCPDGYTSGCMTYYWADEPDIGYGSGPTGSHDNPLKQYESVATPNNSDYGRRVEIQGFGTLRVDDECRGGGCKDFDLYVGKSESGVNKFPDLKNDGVHPVCYKWVD